LSTKFESFQNKKLSEYFRAKITQPTAKPRSPYRSPVIVRVFTAQSAVMVKACSSLMMGTVFDTLYQREIE